MWGNEVMFGKLNNFTLSFLASRRRRRRRRRRRHHHHRKLMVFELTADIFAFVLLLYSVSSFLSVFRIFMFFSSSTSYCISCLYILLVISLAVTFFPTKARTWAMSCYYS
jgi:hypothetical protein